MKSLVLVCSFLLVGITSVSATLPQLSEKPWIGWFGGYEDRKFRFGVKGDGVGVLIPMDDRRDAPVSNRYWIEIYPVIEEVLEGGRVVTKRVDEEALEAITESTEEGGKMSFRGSVTGGATFEAHFETARGQILGGGRILDKGTLTDNPIRFSLRVRIPNLFPYKSKDAIEDVAEDDRIRMVLANREKKSFDSWEPVWAEKEESGDGVQSVRLDLESYDGRKIELEAGDRGLFEFWNGSKQPLYKGFTFGWKPDPEKDPEGEGRFVLEFG